MINLCFVSGKVIEEVKFKFIYDQRTKSLSKKHISIAIVKLKLENGSIINLQGYDEMADFMYRNIQRNGKLLVKGRITKELVVVNKILYF